jgi:tRNA A58 N-methylase Trm61
MAREVNISLRGFLEELPTEVAEFLVVTLRKVGDVEHKLNSVIERLEGGEDINHCVVDLEATRQVLYKVDNRLSDCMSILAGYMQHINNPAQAQESAPSEQEESEN